MSSGSGNKRKQKRLKTKQGWQFIGFEHFRFHDLRHYNASVMLALNLPDKYAMERGGWSTLSVMKDRYRHTFDDRQKQYDVALENYFKQIMQHEK